MSEYYYKNLRTLVVCWLAVWSPPYSASLRPTRAADGGIYPCITKEVGGRGGPKRGSFSGNWALSRDGDVQGGGEKSHVSPPPPILSPGVSSVPYNKSDPSRDSRDEKKRLTSTLPYL